MIAAAELRRRTRTTWHRIFEPPRQLTVSQWADAERYLSPDYNAAAQRVSQPVRWSTADVPYLGAIMDALSDDAIREVTVAKSAQVGGSETGQNWIGYTIHERPAAMLMVCQSTKALKAFSTLRLDPMIRDTPVLRERIFRSARRDSRNTIAAKTFAGGYLQLLTAKSTNDLRSHSSGKLIAEEVDEWEGDLRGQGDPLELLRARGLTFEEMFKLLKISTPLLEGVSRIWSEYEESSRGTFRVPCPHCGEYQLLVWREDELVERMFDIPATGRYRMVFDRDERDQPVPESVRYACRHCEALIEPQHKAAMLAAGRWEHRYPERIPRNCGFWIWQAYSPFVPWWRIIDTFRKAKTPDKLQTFVNLGLGLPFRHAGERIEAHQLSERAEPYPTKGTDDDAVLLVPRGVGVLTAWTDVQVDRLELFVVGWGADEECWVIGWERIEGDPGQDTVWHELDKWRTRKWPREAGPDMTIAALGVDSRYQEERVWTYCESRRHLQVFPTSGRDGRGRPYLEPPGPRKSKGSKQTARPKWIIGTDTAKDWLAARLRVKQAGPEFIHFPDSIDPTFFEQLTAEELVPGWARGRRQLVWRRIGNRANEALDGMIGARAGLLKLGRVVIKQLGELARRQSEGVQTSAMVGPVQPAPPRRRVRSRGIDPYKTGSGPV